MQQRQLRLGDILDDYCPRERRLTNHAVVAMIGTEVKQTRCSTCDAEHEYKHGKVPRQRRKSETPAAIYASAQPGGPKRVVHEPAATEPLSGGGDAAEEKVTQHPQIAASQSAPETDGVSPDDSDAAVAAADAIAAHDDTNADTDTDTDVEEGPVHRPLIRATLPRPEGQPPVARPAPDFTIRQPGGRPNRFRPRHQQQHPRGGNPQFFGGRNGNQDGGPSRGGAPRPHSGRPTGTHLSKRHGPGRKRSK